MSRETLTCVGQLVYYLPVQLDGYSAMLSCSRQCDAECARCGVCVWSAVSVRPIF